MIVCVLSSLSKLCHCEPRQRRDEAISYRHKKSRLYFSQNKRVFSILFSFSGLSGPVFKRFYWLDYIISAVSCQFKICRYFRIVQKSPAKASRYPNGITQYPSIPHPLPHELRTMKRLAR